VAVGAESALDELLELFDEEDMLQELVGTAEAEDSLSGLSFDHLRMMVMGEKRKIVTRQKQFLKTRDRHVACIDTVKLLKDEFDKRWILEGGVTVPWSDINRDIITAVERMDVSYVSNFLQSASVLELQFVDNKFRDHEWFRLLWNSWLDSGEFSAEYFKSQM
jgi:hypothetical protein